MTQVVHISFSLKLDQFFMNENFQKAYSLTTDSEFINFLCTSLTIILAKLFMNTYVKKVGSKDFKIINFNTSRWERACQKY